MHFHVNVHQQTSYDVKRLFALSSRPKTNPLSLSCGGRKATKCLYPCMMNIAAWPWDTPIISDLHKHFFFQSNFCPPFLRREAAGLVCSEKGPSILGVKNTAFTVSNVLGCDVHTNVCCRYVKSMKTKKIVLFTYIFHSK